VGTSVHEQSSVVVKTFRWASLEFLFGGSSKRVLGTQIRGYTGYDDLEMIYKEYVNELSPSEGY
jgi:hypothetical protein